MANDAADKSSFYETLRYKIVPPIFLIFFTAITQVRRQLVLPKSICYIAKCKWHSLIWWAVWPDCYIIFSIFGHLEQREFAQKYKMFVKVGSQSFQIHNTHSRNGPNVFLILPKWWNFIKSGHTLVTESITTQLTSCLTGLDSTKHHLLLYRYH